MKNTITEIIEGKREKSLLMIFLLPLSYIVSILIKIRYLFYFLGIFPSYRPVAKVISIGNLTVGGSGKTPVTKKVTEFILTLNRKPVILSRGYKRFLKEQSMDVPIVVSNNDEIITDVRYSGDEPYLLARNLKNVPVIVGSKRDVTARLAISEFNPDTLILDDGFQHLRIEKDINILLVDGEKAFGNNNVIPAGTLREPISRIKKADIVLIKNKEKAKDEFLNLFKNKKTFSFDYKPICLINKKGEEKPLLELKEKSVLIFSALANPASFKNTIQSLGANIFEEITFPDHHWFATRDLFDIKEKQGAVDYVVTTEKDFVRFSYMDDLPEIYYLKIDVNIDDDFYKEIENILNPDLIKNENVV